ncbi:copper-binding protein [Azospira inquinata]|nr:copper-binding protein [Azospira inquinata]QWT45452.1 copper-binding protein [Azospira inquinata]
MFPKILLIPLVLLPFTALQAQEMSMDHSAAPMGMSPIPIAGQGTVPAESEAPAIPALIRKVDIAKARVMLTHAPVPSLHMSAMTMYFPVKDPAQLQGLKPGMKVQVVFSEREGRVEVAGIRAEE